MGDKQGHPFRGNQWTGGSAMAAFAQAPIDKKGASAWRRKNAELYATDEDFRAVADMVALHAQGDYKITHAMTTQESTGALPEAYLDSALPGWGAQPYFGHPMSKYRDYFPGQAGLDRREGGLSKHTWSKASGLMLDAVEHSEPLEQPIFRGLHGHTAREKFAAMKVGETLDIPGVSSFTADKFTGEEFARGEARGQGGRRGTYKRYGDDVTVIEVEPGARGIRAAALSPWNQQEIITSGRFEVVSVETNQAYRNADRVTRVVLRQVKAGRPN